MIIGIEAAHANKKKRSGVEEVCFRLIQELKKIIPRDVGVVLYSNAPLSGELAALPANWKIKILRWPFSKLWSHLRLSFEFLFSPPDIFFAPGQLIPFFAPKKTAVFVHDSAFEATPEAYRFFGRLYLKWMNRRIVSKAKIIITSTEFNKREMIKYYGKDVESKIRVIPLAYDSEKFTVHSAQFTGDALKKYGIKQPFILSVGRLETKKNTARLIEAFNKIKNNQSNIQLVLAGPPGAGHEAVKEAIEKSPFKKDMILPGFVSEGDLPALYAGAEVFVFPSLYEGFGLPVLEAMASGCPVIASGGGALEEVGGGAAIYVNPQSVDDIARGIGEFLNDQNLREEKIRLGLERVRQFFWNKTAWGVWESMRYL